jgi:hypothetical protein
MTGEQLLLWRVLGGPQVTQRIDAELDRRSLLGPPEEGQSDRTAKRSRLTAAGQSLQVA